MTSVPLTLEVNSLHNDEETKLLRMKDAAGYPLEFQYHIHCRWYDLDVFFNVKSNKCFMSFGSWSHVTNLTRTHRVYFGHFAIINDLPHLSTFIFERQQFMAHDIAEDFRHQYASYLVDTIIDS